MKKILALALAAAMSLTLVACGGSKTPAASGSASSGGSSSAETVDFPGNKQVSLIVPYSAGGASDTVARIYASELEQSLGTSIVVSNVTGASGQPRRLHHRLHARGVHHAEGPGLHRPVHR